MKRNDLTDLKTKSIDELRKKLLDLREEINKARSDMSRDKIKNTNFFRSKKKEIAQVLTFLSIKDIVSAAKEKGGSE